MSLNPLRHLDLFDPSAYHFPTHILGVGGSGSELARMLTKYGVGQNAPLHLWDFDVVESHNPSNQAYNPADVGLLKVDALLQHISNWSGASAKAEIHRQKVTEKIPLEGVVFLCFDKNRYRKETCLHSIFDNPAVALCIDLRLDARTAQAYVMDPNNPRHTDFWRKFWVDDDKTENLAGCGGQLGMLTAVVITAALGVESLIQWFATRDATKVANFLELDLHRWRLRAENWG